MTLTEIIKATDKEMRRIDELVPHGPDDEIGQRFTVEQLGTALAALREARSMHSFFLPGIDPR